MLSAEFSGIDHAPHLRFTCYLDAPPSPHPPPFVLPLFLSPSLCPNLSHFHLHFPSCCPPSSVGQSFALSLSFSPLTLSFPLFQVWRITVVFLRLGARTSARAQTAWCVAATERCTLCPRAFPRTPQSCEEHTHTHTHVYTHTQASKHKYR